MRLVRRTGLAGKVSVLRNKLARREGRARRIPAYAGTVEPIDANTCRYTTGDDDLSWLALRIAMLGVDFEVHEPPELREHLQILALRFAHAAP